MVKPSKFIENIEPYKITPQDVWSDSAPSDILKLDWNEAPVDFSFYREEIHRISQETGIIAWYPDYLALDLTDALESFVGIDGNHILTFPGSDVGLETLCRAYLQPNDVVVAICPTYENFFVYANQTGANLIKLDLDVPYVIDHKYIEENILLFSSAKLVYLVSPNNPCGYVIDRDIVKKLAEMLPETLFVVDEAYIEFSDTPSISLLVEEVSNVVVFRTFSKAFGMAGVRLGYMCSSLDIINVVNKIRNGKNISMIAQRLGLYALSNFEKIQTWIDDVKYSRNRLQKWFLDKGVKSYPSQGNFILFEVSHPSELCSRLKANGIYVRNRNSVIPKCVRVTIGSKAHVDRLIKVIETMPELL